MKVTSSEFLIFALLTACKQVKFIMFSMSAPEHPCKIIAASSNSYSDIEYCLFFKWTFMISSLSIAFGSLISILWSNLPGLSRAGSKF